MYKHFIRTDANGIVIDGYADWETEKRKPDEIELSGDHIRQFQINLYNERMQFKYKVVGGQMVERVQAELDSEWNARPVPPDPDVELSKAILAATTLDELKKALTGSNGKLAKVKGELK